MIRALSGIYGGAMLSAAGEGGGGDPGDPPVIASFSQSTNYAGAGVQPASVANMSDGLREPFAATISTPNQYIQATLAESAYVTSVTLQGGTTTGGWGPTWTNGAKLQWTNDASPGPSSTWTDITTTAGFEDGLPQTIPVGATCTALRLSRATSYVVVGEFTVA